MVEDFERGLAAIQDATGIDPRLHRPPYGIYSRASLRIARDRGLQPLLWSKWGKDWRKVTTPEQITARVVAGLRAGDVVLLHDADYYSALRSYRRTAAALPEIMNMLKSAGLSTVTCP
jgi:peptidoglycan/xylan/chitin deacetylase (PgdA/CDA1 family)